MPEIPPSWSQTIAAVGAILVIVLLLRWTAEVLKGQGQQSATLIDRSFDIADKIVAAGVPVPANSAPPLDEPGPAPEPEPEPDATPQHPPI